jgi:transposase
MTKRKTETVNDLSRCLDPLDMDATLIAVIEMSQSSWLVGGIIPGVERQPLKKLAIDEHALLKLLSRWRGEAEKKGHRITRIAVAFEAGHDGFWLARWLAAQGIEAHVIHASSVAVTREHRRAKTDRLDTGLLKRGFLGWLRGERGHCKMVAVPTLAEEDAKRPSRERETLVGEASRIITRVKAAFVRLGIRRFNPKLKTAAAHLETLRTPEGEPIPPNTLAALKRDLERHRIVKQQIREIEETRLERLAQAPSNGPHAMVRLLARVIDPAGVAVPHVPEGQCARQMVSAADGECPVDPQDVGGGAGAQAADRALASGARRRRARRCTAASRRLIEEPADVVVPSYGFAPIRLALMGSR